MEICKNKEYEIDNCSFQNFVTLDNETLETIRVWRNLIAYKSYITQEMLKKGFLAGTSMYACIAHTPEIIDAYFDALDPIFRELREFEDGKDVMKALEGPVCQSGFKRLN